MTPQPPLTTPTRHADRMSWDQDLVYAVLDEALVCHVSYVVDGAPRMIPTLQVRVGDRLYLHGSTGSNLARTSRDGIDICVAVTIPDGLVLARSVMHHSMNYRSVIAHGTARLVTSESERDTVFAALVEHVTPGRSTDARPPTARERSATALMCLDLDQVAMKTRSGDPVDDDADLALPHWAGVIPLRTVRGNPIPAANLNATLGLPPYLA